jgi:hypothetical protein
MEFSELEKWELCNQVAAVTHGLMLKHLVRGYFHKQPKTMLEEEFLSCMGEFHTLKEEKEVIMKDRFLDFIIAATST